MDNVPHFVFSPILLSVSFPSAAAAAAAAAFPPSVRGREPQKLALAGERSWVLGTGYYTGHWALAAGYFAVICELLKVSAQCVPDLTKCPRVYWKVASCKSVE